MRGHLSLIFAFILIITCSGCIWGWDPDRRGYYDRDREHGHEDRVGDSDQDRGEHGERDRGGHDDHISPMPR